MLDLKETWENLLMWLLCLCTFLLQELFSLYGLWVAIHCFENKIVVKLHAFLWTKSVLLGEVVVLSSTFVFFHEGIYLFCHCTIQKTQVKKVKLCLSGELPWSSQKKFRSVWDDQHPVGLEKDILYKYKDIFCLVTSVVQRKNSESLWGIKPQTFGFCASML